MLALSAVFLFFSGAYLSYAAVTISPVGSLTGAEEEMGSINCTFPNVGGVASLLYNRNETTAINTAMQSEISVAGIFRGVTNPLGSSTIQGNTVLVVGISFILKSVYNGAVIRCKFLSTLGSAVSTSQSLTLNVLSSPCCNTSQPPVVRNLTEVSTQLRLNCSDIIEERGNPPAMIDWTASRPSGCVGSPTGNASEFYVINPISRKCNGAAITCVADTKDSRLTITAQTFNLIIKTVPGIPRRQLIPQGQSQWYPTPFPNGAGIEWLAPVDDGGFQILDYQYGVTDEQGSVVVSKMSESSTSADVFDLGVAKRYNFTVSARNALGKGSSLTLPFTSPDVPGLVSGVRAETVSRSSIRISWTALQPDVSFELNVTKYVIVSVNGTDEGINVSSPGTSVTAEGLPFGTCFNLSIHAENGVQGGNLRKTFFVGCTNPEGVPDTVDTLTAVTSLIKCTSATLKWKSVDAGGDGFEIKMYVIEVSSNGAVVKEVTKEVPAVHGPDVEHEVTGLKEKTEYSFRVAAKNELRQGRFSASVTATTTSCASSGLVIGLAVGITLGVLVVIVAVILIYYFYIRKRKDSKSSPEPSPVTPDTKKQVDDSQKANRAPKQASGGKKAKKKATKNDSEGVMYADLELAEGGPMKENRAKDSVQYSDLKPGTEYADLDLGRPSSGNLQKVKKSKEEQSVPYTGVTKLAEY